MTGRSRAPHWADDPASNPSVPAREHVGASRPGLIILDLKLPGLHGLDVLAEIKADPELIITPVVILSSTGHPDDIRRSYERYANAYIVNATDFDGFQDMIKRIDTCFPGLIEPPSAPGILAGELRGVRARSWPAGRSRRLLSLVS